MTADRAASSDADREDEAALDALVLAYQAGDAGALEQIQASLAPELGWGLYRARRQLALAPSLEAADLGQEAWLALVETARTWQPAVDGPFRRAAIRALRRGLRRCLRRNRAPARFSLGDDVEIADRDPLADASRWNDAVLARSVLASLSAAERRALVWRAVGERPLDAVAHRLGLSRRATQHLLRRAELRARATAGIEPPAASWEAAVLAAARGGADPRTGRIPTLPWLGARTRLGRRRLRAVLAGLGQLGYLEARGARWYVRRQPPAA